MTVTLEQGDQAEEGLCKLVFAEDLTIYAIEALKEGLAAHLVGYESFELNLAQVEEMDSAGVQLLLAFKSELMREKKQLRLTHMSPVVTQLLASYGLGERFNTGDQNE